MSFARGLLFADLDNQEIMSAKPLNLTNAGLFIGLSSILWREAWKYAESD
jgi:hypothetical protein